MFEKGKVACRQLGVLVVLLMLISNKMTVNASYFDRFFAGGTGTIGNPYQIETAEQLMNISQMKYGNFIQISDIDLSHINNWEPIGINGDNFHGSYNGNGFAIRNLKINRPDEEDVGLFGASGSVDFRNIIIENATVLGGENVGILVGDAYAQFGYEEDEAVIFNCSVSGSVSGYHNVGGLAGSSIGSVMSYCNTDVNISSLGHNSDGFSSSFGGLLGYHTDGNVDYCSSSGIISLPVLDKYEAVGGLVGYSFGGEFSNSWSDATVQGEQSIGGLVGVNRGKVFQCRSYGSASGYVEVGGLIGTNIGYSDDAIVERSVSHAKVDGTFNVGGLVGENYSYTSNALAKIYTSYSDGETRGDYSVGGLVGFDRDGIIEECFSSGDVIGIARVGGLVGETVTEWSTFPTCIKNCYTISLVDGLSDTGCLIGMYDCMETGSKIINTYSVGGAGKSIKYIGVIEYEDQAEIVHSYSMDGVGNDITGVEIKSESDLMKKETYRDWDFQNVWTIDENNDFPKLMWKENYNFDKEQLSDVSELKQYYGVKASNEKYSRRKDYDGSQIIDLKDFVSIMSCKGRK